MVALEARLPAVLRGDESPVDAAECLAFADMAYRSKRFGASARLYAEALQADPVRAEDADQAGLRDHEALATLPTEEQQACRKLWAEVDALLARVGRP
jgi:hypothetical protein